MNDQLTVIRCNKCLGTGKLWQMDEQPPTGMIVIDRSKLEIGAVVKVTLVPCTICGGSGRYQR